MPLLWGRAYLCSPGDQDRLRCGEWWIWRSSHYLPESISGVRRPPSNTYRCFRVSVVFNSLNSRTSARTGVGENPMRPIEAPPSPMPPIFKNCRRDISMVLSSRSYINALRLGCQEFLPAEYKAKSAMRGRWSEAMRASLPLWSFALSRTGTGRSKYGQPE